MGFRLLIQSIPFFYGVREVKENQNKIYKFLENRKPESFGAVTDYDVWYHFSDNPLWISWGHYQKALALGRKKLQELENEPYNEADEKLQDDIRLVMFVESCKSNSLYDKRTQLFNEDGKAWLDRYDKLAKQRTEVSSTNVNVSTREMTLEEAIDEIKKAGLDPNAIK